MQLAQKIKIRGYTFSYKDLLLMLPSKYEYRFFLEDVSKILPNTNYKFIFYIKDVTKFPNNKILINGTIENKPFKIIHSLKLYKYLSSQYCINACGKFENNTSYFPEIMTLTKKSNDIIPIYKELTHNGKKAMRDAVDSLSGDLKNLFEKIHFPQTIEEPQDAIIDLLTMELGIFFNIIKQLQKFRTPYEIHDIKSPFILTNDQKQTWKEICGDFQNNFRAIRIVHGDVGSGKTLIAYLSALQVAKNGKKVAILAPTSMLAQQIYAFFIENNYENFNIGLIISSTTKKKDLEKLKNNNIFIGTHALLYKDYVGSLGLLIIDEQHKFGVNQRNSLLKDSTADVIMLTATVIPRTFQMMSKGYIKFSELKDVPSSGKRNTFVLSEEDIDNILLKMFDIAKSNKVIWVCKTIELALERQAYFEQFCENVFLIHGKIKEKNDILKHFDTLESGILISTTVIEVGIDIDINFIFIEQADMFGLAQLHQMRGRVGRRNTDGYCFLIGRNITKLRQIKRADDGFSITELDTGKRGGGMIHGTQQSGFSAFKFAKRIANGKLIECDISDKIFEGVIEKSKEINITDEIVNLIGDFDITDIKI